MTDAIVPQGTTLITHFDQLQRAVEEAAADNRHVVLQEATTEAGERAYFLSTESAQARSIRNIKAALGLSTSGKQHDLNIKNAFIKLAIEHSRGLSGSQSSTGGTVGPLSSREAVDQVIGRLRSVNTNTLKNHPAEAFIQAINNTSGKTSHPKG